MVIRYALKIGRMFRAEYGPVVAVATVIRDGHPEHGRFWTAEISGHHLLTGGSLDGWTAHCRDKRRAKRLARRALRETIRQDAARGARTNRMADAAEAALGYFG